MVQSNAINLVHKFINTIAYSGTF